MDGMKLELIWIPGVMLLVACLFFICVSRLTNMFCPGNRHIKEDENEKGEVKEKDVKKVNPQKDDDEPPNKQGDEAPVIDEVDYAAELAAM